MRQLWTAKALKLPTLVSQEVGYDSGKKIKGRKRHILVDTLGLLIVVVITAANVSEQAGAKPILLG
ncbi:transposase [Nostoc sp. UHCC 0926]|uniref:transposase n=1 Tax=Nostoc sp. UHCC 0926 TaxID=3025190 RepID=UPI003FCF1765